MKLSTSGPLFEHESENSFHEELLTAQRAYKCLQILNQQESFISKDFHKEWMLELQKRMRNISSIVKEYGAVVSHQSEAFIAIYRLLLGFALSGQNQGKKNEDSLFSYLVWKNP